MANRKRKKMQLNVRGLVTLVRSPLFKVALGLVIIASIAAGFVFMHYYNTYATIIDRRLSGEVFQQTAKIYATPYVLYTGQAIERNDVLARLRRAGFTPVDYEPEEDGVYQVLSGGERSRVIVSPEGGQDFRLDFGPETLENIYELPSALEIPEVELPPELVTSLFDQTRARRREIQWEELPLHLTDAIVASEDQRFYRHMGVDPIRALGALIANMRGDQLQGASTLTMQLAGSFFLDRSNRTWERKLPEVFMALILEQRLTKDEILTMYANEMYLGHRSSFGIYGFGEAADQYFGKQIQDLTLAEAATLVGILPRPAAYSPLNNPELALERRNVVLNEMYETEAITAEELAAAEATLLTLADVTVDASDAPYMVDYVREQLLVDFSDAELLNDGLKIYTTLDPALQQIAVKAVADGLVQVNEQLRAQGYIGEDDPGPQATLIVIDPHSGEIKAMVGGSDYGESQYNRITEAFRQPGSIFKPFVYAAAMETAFNPIVDPIEVDPIEPTELEDLEDPELTLPDSLQSDEALQPIVFRQDRGDPEDEDAVDGLILDLLEDMGIENLEEIPERVERGMIDTATTITPITTVMDEPTLFVYEDQEKYYEPNNYLDVFYGLITVREALQRSLNIPTVKVAERIGFDRVAELAHRLGLNGDIRPFPSIALGAFEVTPIEMVGAYTAFANEGVRVEPRAISRVVAEDGTVLRSYELESEAVLSPEIAYLMTNLLENVVNRGTGAGVRSRGFTLPAAGKTGTSRDGWFAGYTKNLLAVAWVGFDDNSELNLEGSRSALPIWTQFMLDAYELHPVRPRQNMRFLDPPGVETVVIDAVTMTQATPYCPETVTHTFIAGTAPTAFCPLHQPGFFVSDTVGDAVDWIGDSIINLF